jgi:hypothetical protein
MARLRTLPAILILLSPGLAVYWAGDPPEPPLLDIARSYTQYGYVDGVERVAPTMCKAPTRPAPRRSASRDTATHGQKTYYLFAKDRLAYLQATDLDQPEGQVVVKESWIRPHQEAGPLFIMSKSGGEWTYSTVSPDGGTVTASGRIASCIECHESASTRDRMFGVAPYPAEN